MLENICLYADPNQTFVVAVVIPTTKEVSKLSDLPVEVAINQPEVHQSIVKELEKFGVKHGLEKIECPKRVFMTLDEWTPDTGLVTAAFKIRRRFIVEKYQKQIDELYA